jgi:hypothetical protein
MSQSLSFSYRIAPDGSGWKWSVFDRTGACSARGEADSRSLAAALVIRAIARGMEPALAA